MSIEATEDRQMTIETALERYLDSRIGSYCEEQALRQLLAAARPMITASLRVRARRFDADDREEFENETMLRLIQRLRDVKGRQDGRGIANFSSYVAITANNVVFSHLRRAHPERRRVRRAVSEALRSSMFARWETGSGESVAGFRVWLGNDHVAPWEALVEIAGSIPAPGSLTPRNVEIVLEQTFRRSRRPVAIERLVEIVAVVFGRSLTSPEPGPVASVADTAPSAEQRLIERSALAAVWSEIERLPPRQWAALLLNLRDGEGSACLSLLVERGITSLAGVAAAAGLSAPQLRELWDQLPLDDLTIAGSWGMTRQSVINLRKSARERLNRRLRRDAVR
jgi:RNA polymerase sigma factor (sigma-70 family)